MSRVLSFDPPTGGTLHYIESLIPSLVPSEQRVAREVVQHGGEVAMMSAADLASRTGTSAATVIRACQSLGFKGFQHLRLLLLRDLPSSPEPLQVGPGARPADWLPAMYRAAGAELEGALAPMDWDAFDRAVAAIVAAPRVLVVGNGASGPVAQLAALGLMASGRPVEAPLDAVAQQLGARSLRGADVCLCISGSGMNSVTLRVASAAVEAGAVLVGVTSYQRSRLDELSAVSLVCGSTITGWSNGGISGNLAHILLMSGLELAISAATGRPPSDPQVVDEVMRVLSDDASAPPA